MYSRIDWNKENEIPGKTEIDYVKKN